MTERPQNDPVNRFAAKRLCGEDGRRRAKSQADLSDIHRRKEVPPPQPRRVVITDLVITTRFLLPSEKKTVDFTRFRGIIDALAAAHS